MKSVKFLTIVILVWSSQAMALTPMGPPIPDVEQGRFGLDFGYGYGKIDLRVSGYGISETLPDTDYSTIFAQLNYGIFDNWQGSVRLGLVDVEGDVGVTCGFGSKVGIGEYLGLDWGALFQLNWFNVEEEETIDGYSGTVELDIYELQIAFGPTYKTENFSIYGGPFLHFIEGDLTGFGLNFDLEQESELGGYVGISTEIADNMDLNLEFQSTGDAQAVGLKLVWRF